MAKRIRIHNDIQISWGITTNGEKVSLEDRQLRIKMVVFNRVFDVSGFTVKGNVVSFVFKGEDQQHCGTYILVCQDMTDGNLNTIDKTDAFVLVPHTEEECGTDNPNVALEVVTLDTDRDSSGIAKAATISIGKVITLPEGVAAYVKNVGTKYDAILEFGIPTGTGGIDGKDGIDIIADPPFIILNANEDGTIPSEQDTLVNIGVYRGGKKIEGATIYGIVSTNFINDITKESNNTSFYVRGSNIKTEKSTDLDGNQIVVPCTQASVYVQCSVPDSEMLYSTSVPVYINTQSFYTSLVSNQREFKRTFTEYQNKTDGLDTKLDRYYSEFQQTATGILSKVTANKKDADGKYETLNSKFSQTAEGFSATVDKYTQETDTKIESYKSEITQKADEISATVESTKTDLEGKIESNTSLITQKAEEISATVTANKKDADSKIESNTSLITQTANEIKSTISANKQYADGRIDDCYSNITQNANQIQQTISSWKTDVSGDIQNLQSQITQNASDISIANSRFNSDGSLKNTSGLLTTADKASLVSKDYVDGKVISAAEISTMIKEGISYASIAADQISFSGHLMQVGTGQIIINTDGFKLDSSGNATFAGDLTAKTLRLNKCSTSVASSGAIYFGNNLTLPTLDVGIVMQCILVGWGLLIPPNISTSKPVLTAQTSNVNIADAAKYCDPSIISSYPSTVTLDYGLYLLIGVGYSASTLWLYSKLT